MTVNLNDILQTSEEKKDFLKGLIRISKCDSLVDKAEIEYFNEAAESFGLDENAKSELRDAWKSEEKSTVKFNSTKKSMFFFTQAIQLCYADDNYAESEKNEIRLMAKEMGIPVSSIVAIEAWVEEGIQWSNRIVELLNLE